MRGFPLFEYPAVVAIIGSFSNDDGDGYENVKTTIGLLNETSTLHVRHAFLYISLLLLPGGGGHSGIVWVGMCRPELQIGTPF